MRREYASEAQATAVAKEALWLAFKAAGGPQGMGFLQDRKGASKEDVWGNATTMGDYPGSHEPRADRINADYVFGRMLKLYIRLPTPDSIDVPDNKPRWDYQSWCEVYPTYDALFDAAEKESIT